MCKSTSVGIDKLSKGLFGSNCNCAVVICWCSIVWKIYKTRSSCLSSIFWSLCKLDHSDFIITVLLCPYAGIFYSHPSWGSWVGKERSRTRQVVLWAVSRWSPSSLGHNVVLETFLCVWRFARTVWRRIVPLSIDKERGPGRLSIINTFHLWYLISPRISSLVGLPL